MDQEPSGSRVRLILWHPGRVEQWTYNGAVYQVNSMYLLPDGAWTYELTGPHGTSGKVTGLAVVIPDATPDDGPFTPMDSTHAHVVTDDGHLPWPVLLRFIRLVETSGDIAPGAHGGTVTGDLSSSLNSWRFADRAFEVDSYHFADRDSWCYELYEADSADTRNDYIDVCIPNLQPAGGPFVPATAGHAVFTAHGSWPVPWLVFRHFLDAVAASGDIVDDPLFSTKSPWEEAGLGPSAIGGRRAENVWVVPPASNPAPPDFGAGDLELVLVAPGPTPIELIRRIRQITGFGLMDSRALLETCPSVVVTGLSEAQTADLRDALRSAGATADIRLRQDVR